MDKPKIVVMGGTTEGRNFAALLSPFSEVHLTAATEYAGQILEKEQYKDIVMHIGRLDEVQMKEFVRQINPLFLLDATHPYAKEVSKTAKKVCESLGITYYRMTRDRQAEGNAIHAKSTEEAAFILSQTTGNILLTCGSKEMKSFTTIENFRERIFARVLPQEDVLRSCREMGYKPSQLTLMQGPFSKEFNKAHLQMTEAKFLVTKDSGIPGGFPEKLEAAKELGVQVIVIDREEEEGCSQEEMANLFSQIYGWCLREKGETQDETKHRFHREYFPFFYKIKDKKILIFGGGNIGKRRLHSLLGFNCMLTVISPECHPDILEMEKNKEVSVIHRGYIPLDCRGADYVLACTNDDQVNEEICMECRKQGIPVNTAHSKDLSDFYFPGIVTKGDIVVGVTAGGHHHKMAREATENVRIVLEGMITRGEK